MLEKVDSSLNISGSIKIFKFSSLSKYEVSSRLRQSSINDTQMSYNEDIQTLLEMTCPLVDISTIGKTFSVQYKSYGQNKKICKQTTEFDHLSQIKRQYFGTFSLNSKVYSNLIKLGENPYNQKAAIEICTQINNINNAVCFMAIQEHPKSKGLSWLIHNDVRMEHKYQIKGKMGIPLEIWSQGTHVAFAGGTTGILAFIDLIGHMVFSLVSEYTIGKI